jgi:membrane-bound serine protease (ClpP class)
MMTVRRAAAIVLLAFGALGTAHAASAAPRVVRLDLDGAVQPLSAAYVADGIHAAESQHASAVLLRIDTPGGFDGSMRRIVGAVLNARVPVVCWVGPDGARAASAGTFILLACPVATMAPGTNVGAAHPVGLQGEVLSDKITNDAAAFIRSIAQERGRDAGWAEQAVRDSVSVSAPDAVKLGVIDFVATSPAEALAGADGRSVRIGQRNVTLDVSPADVRREAQPFGRALVGTLVDPNLAFLLFLLGIAGIVFEVLHPGLSVPGVLGLLSIVLALVMFEMLPVNLGGVVLILAGVVFLVIELHVPGFGLPGAAGIASLVIGGMLLYNPHTFVRVSRPLIVGAVIGKALFWLVVVRGALRARRMAPPVKRTLVGEQGVTTTDLAPTGTVRVRSELWTAEAATDVIPAGRRVIVVEEEGLRLRVMEGD